MKKLVSALMISTLAFAACSKTEKVIERLPPEKMAESFTVNEQDALIIKKESLGKAFLLLASSKKLTTKPEWLDHRAQVVSFEMFGNRVGLYELGKNQVYENIPATKLIQSFKVLSENDKEIHIDLGQGFKSINNQENLEGLIVPDEDFEMKNMGAQPKVEVVDSLVKKKSLDNNRITIVQDSKVREQKITAPLDKKQTGGYTVNQKLQSYEYGLQTYFELLPYIENTDFKAKVLDAKLRVGFFATNHNVAESSDQEKLATLWDLSPAKGPIRFILSKDIPQQYVPDITKALEYWNRVFKKNVLTVEQSQDSDLLPQDRAVLVRWVNWKDANFAYAGFHINPLTGEILRGQIYLPSGWTQNSARDKNAGLGEAAARLRMTMAVSHEAGHIFGMRHNFTASHSIKTPVRELQMARAQVKGQVFDAARTPLFSTSVMDYFDDVDGVIVGLNIQERVLDYDVDAIAWGYQGLENPNTPESGFCTDDHIQIAMEKKGTALGCERADGPGNPLIAGLAKYRELIRDAIAKSIQTNYIAAIYATSSRTPLKLDQAFQNPYVVLPAQAMDLMFTKNLENKVTNNLFSWSALNERVIQSFFQKPTGEIYDSAIGNDLNKVFEEAKQDADFNSLLYLKDEKGALDLSWVDKAVEEILANPAILKGTTAAGISYELNQQDLSEIRAALALRLPDLKRSIVVAHAKTLLPEQQVSEWDYENSKSILVKTAYRLTSGSLNLEAAGLDLVFSGMVSVTPAVKVGLINGQTPFIAGKSLVSTWEFEGLKSYLKTRKEVTGPRLAALQTLVEAPLRKLLNEVGVFDIKNTDFRTAVLNAYSAGKIDVAVYTWAYTEAYACENIAKFVADVLK